MKFLFDLYFSMIAAIVLILIFCYSPVKTMMAIGIYLLACIVLGVLIWAYRNKHQKA